jgi:hypothetical protein
MTVIVPGVYKQGKLELLQTPVGLREGPVRVMLTEEGSPEGRRLLTYGKYTSGRSSTLDDFRDAEWHGEAEFDDRHAE